MWRYVPTNDNPADMGSRGNQHSKQDLWMNGLTWLQNPESWPTNITAKPSIESEAETKPTKELVNVAVIGNNEMDNVLAKFNLQKAIRICSWIHRFMNNALRSRETAHIAGPLTTAELERQRVLFITAPH
jgi:hypothetical protein